MGPHTVRCGDGAVARSAWRLGIGHDISCCLCAVVQAAAASAMLLHNSTDEDEGGTAPAAAEVLELGPALYKVAQVSAAILQHVVSHLAGRQHAVLSEQQVSC
jgi:hypothetical protein